MGNRGHFLGIALKKCECTYTITDKNSLDKFRSKELVPSYNT